MGKGFYMENCLQKIIFRIITEVFKQKLEQFAYMRFTLLLSVFFLASIHFASAQNADSTYRSGILNMKFIQYQTEAGFRYQRTARDLTVSFSSILVGAISSALLYRYGGIERKKEAIAAGSAFGALTIGFGVGAIWNINRAGKVLSLGAEELKKY